MSASRGIIPAISSRVQPIYDRYVREHLPSKVLVLNGIPVRNGRLLDATDSYHNYEEACLSSLREYVRKGDDVTVIGGGLGVSATVCARMGADVTVYEAAAEKCDMIADTVDLNLVSNRVTIKEAIVGEAVDVFGSPVETVVSPAEIESCDVLELDCEGAEMQILEGITFTPQVIVVEVHPRLGVEESEVRSLLDDEEYDVSAVGTHEAESGIVILEAIKR